jgi:hypothetical protein
MNRETVAMLLCLSFVPAVILTLAGVAPWALPMWATGWIVSLLTKEKA